MSKATDGRAFVFLAYGASPTPGDPLYSAYLPGGMVGIGVQKAAAIWDLALQGYMTPAATFASTRQAILREASTLRRWLAGSEVRHERFPRHLCGRPGARPAIPHRPTGRGNSTKTSKRCSQR